MSDPKSNARHQQLSNVGSEDKTDEIRFAELAADEILLIVQRNVPLTKFQSLMIERQLAEYLARIL